MTDLNWRCSVRCAHRGARLAILTWIAPRRMLPRMKVRALVSSFLLAAVSTGAVWAGPQQPAAPAPAPEPLQKLTPSEIKIYKSAQTLIDWTPRQIHGCPFLHNLRAAESQDQLSMVLEHVGQMGTVMFQDFPRISCDEEVSSAWNPTNASAAFENMHYTPKHRLFRYIVLPRPVGNVLAFEEYRTDSSGNPLDASSLRNLFMVTSDFASTWLYLSAGDQRGSRFRYFGTQTMRNRECHVVGFAQDPDRVPSVGILRIGDASGALLVQGLAWIDSQTSQILRIITWLLAPRTDVGLSSQTSTVDFYPVQPSGSERVFWLPRDVVVEAVYRGMWARNTHHYSNFKLFRVESTIKPAE